jgi:hypothetical protein
MRERRWGVQANWQHHIAAIGELTPESGDTVKNVVGNYWTSGMAIVYRGPKGKDGLPTKREREGRLLAAAPVVLD